MARIEASPEIRQHLIQLRCDYIRQRNAERRIIANTRYRGNKITPPAAKHIEITAPPLNERWLSPEPDFQ